MKDQLSEYKFKKLSYESFINGLRLHFDSILLFNNKSYPSAFQLSVLALEEFSKSFWIEHYYSSSKSNIGFPDKEFEQGWLKLLYIHPEKQKAFFGWGMMFEYSPKFVAFVQARGLEAKKQIATYVGLERNKTEVNTASRISTPLRIKEKDAKQLISLINDYIKDLCKRKLYQEYYFDIEIKDQLLTNELVEKLNSWKFQSGIMSNRWFKEWNKKSCS